MDENTKIMIGQITTGVIFASLFVGIFILTGEWIIERLKKKNKDTVNSTSDRIDDFYRKLDYRLCEFDIESKKHKYLIKKWDAMELLDKTLDKVSNKLYSLVSEKLNTKIIYKENKDGKLEATVDRDMIATILEELKSENKLFRELTE